MAENSGTGNDDRTEEATQERRDDFRERGQIAQSREVSAVLTLLACGGFMIYAGPTVVRQILAVFVSSFEHIATFRIDQSNILPFIFSSWMKILYFIVPICLLVSFVAIMATFLQTRFSWSWKKLEPDFSRMNPLSGLVRMVNPNAGFELLKSIGKMVAVGFVAFLILRGEWNKVPGLMMLPITKTWVYWSEITMQLIWSVGAFLFFMAATDFLYNFFSIERRMKMTKQEVKEEYKRRETDPQVKARMRRLQRDIMTKKTLEKTKQATVLITNPTHYAIAIKYDIGMSAPIVVAKGVDFIALKMRELAKEINIPIVENKPLARTLYKVVEPGQEVPESLYKAVAEVIRYVFKLKGVSINKGTKNSRQNQRNNDDTRI